MNQHPQVVYIVDDDASIREFLAMSLKAAGFTVVTAANGHQARIQATGHPIDLIITDLAIPDKDGIQLIRDLRNEHITIKIIAMSGVFGDAVLEAARLLGADAILRKPLTPATVLQSIEEVSLKAARH